MNINEIAQKLLDLREKRMTSFIMAGALREELGFEGYGEALRRRWITPDDQGSGMVTVSNNLTTVAEIRELAQEAKKKCEKCDGECKCEEPKMESVDESAHFMAASHAYRKHQPVTEYATMGLGRTGDAPETPVPALGNEHSTPAPTTSNKPPVASTGAPAPAAANRPGALANNVVQAETLAQQKFGRPFAQLSPDQQSQIQNDLQRMPPA